jgi:hypothetical protein
MLPRLGYGTISAYQRLPAGRYAVSIRAPGAGTTTPPALTLAVDLPAGAARTVALDDRFADLRLSVLTDDLGAPPPGAARVRAVDAAGSVPAVDLSLAGGPVLAAGLRFPGTSGAAAVPAGAATLRLTVGGRSTDLPVQLPGGAVVTLLVLDAPGGGVTVQPVVDAAGAAVAPVGGVDAGWGGTARSPSWAAVAAVATIAVLGSAGAGRPALRTAAGLVLAVALHPAPAGPRTSAAAPPPPAVAVGRPSGTQVAAPVRLTVPAVGIDAPLRAVGLDAAGRLTAPADPTVAGWLAAGPAPGAAGPAVLAGHVDDAAGPAVFFRLSLLRPGDTVGVARADGSTAGFVVDRVARYPKTSFPTAEVYGPAPDPQLRLVTCGGRFDATAGSYTDNVVVYAHLVT